MTRQGRTNFEDFSQPLWFAFETEFNACWWGLTVIIRIWRMIGKYVGQCFNTFDKHNKDSLDFHKCTHTTASPSVALELKPCLYYPASTFKLLWRCHLESLLWDRGLRTATEPAASMHSGPRLLKYTRNEFNFLFVQQPHEQNIYPILTTFSPRI